MSLNVKSLDLELGSTQYAGIADASQTGLDITGNLSVQAWVKPESFANSPVFAGKCDSNGQTGYQIGGVITTGKINVNIDQSNNGSDMSQARTTATISTGSWSHVCVTYTASTGQIVVYLNGGSAEALDTDTQNATAIYDNAQPFNIGATGGPGNHYDGLIDEVRVWNKVLSEADNAANYNRQIGAQANLVGYWKMEDDYTDTSGNGNTLTAVNTPVFSTDVPFVGTTEGGAFLLNMI